MKCYIPNCLRHIMLMTLVLIMSILCFVDVCAQRQSDTLHLTRAMLEQGFTFNSTLFKYHAGDDMAWAKADFDDSGWQSIKNDTAGRQLMRDGIGWLRYHIITDSVMPTLNSTIELLAYSAATEVFINDSLKARNGLPHALPDQEVAPSKQIFPFFSIVLTGKQHYTISIRVSSAERRIIQQWWSWSGLMRQQLEYGVNVRWSAMPERTNEAYTIDRVQRTLLVCSSIGILLTIGFFFCYLAWYDRSDKLSRYFALYMMTILVSLVPTVTIYYSLLTKPLSDFEDYLLRITNTTFITFGVAFLFLCALIYCGYTVRKRTFLSLILLSIAVVGLSLFDVQGINQINLLLGTKLRWYMDIERVVLNCITIIIVAQSMYRRRTERHVLPIGFGIVITSVAITFGTVYYIAILGYSIFPTAFFVPVYVAVPFGLAFPFIQKVISDRSRLARYSEDLERQVKERTQELAGANEEIKRQLEVQAEQAREIELANTELQQQKEIIEEERNQLERINQALDIERDKSETLLLNILPASIAERIKHGETTIAEHFDSVSVLFSDVVGFTKLSQRIAPQQLVALLDEVFSAFDAIAEQLHLEKIKTIGDAYMVVGGVPEPLDASVQRMADMALAMQSAIDRINDLRNTELAIRIGIHSGEVVAGVIGKKKFAYDLWGDTVNTASRMESHGEAGKIHITETVYDILQHDFICEYRGLIDIKGKGLMKTWFVVQKK